MDERIVKFIKALRAAGVRVSLAESEDAFKAVNKMGIKNRDNFRLALRATTVKEAEDIPAFEELFPLFFGGGNLPPLMNVSEDLTQEEADKIAQALRNFSQQMRKMMERLLKGQKLSQEELERLAQFVGLNQVDNLRYREWMTERMKKALQFRQVRQALRELMEMLAQMGMDKQRVDQLQKLLQGNQESMEDQLRQFSGQRIAENMTYNPPEDSLDKLLNRPFSSLSDRDMDILRKEVRRLAAALKTRVALRQKRAKSGQLDAKATIRANLKHGNVPMIIKHREKSLKPKLVVICDISTSMRSVSEFMMSFLYALQDHISKTHAFAFIDHLEYISPDFRGRDASEAVAAVLERMPSGYYNTDLGYSLENFSQDYMGTVDSRTTFILVGDGRNNYNDPGMDVFTKIARRCNKVIWLTPEPASLWGTGDSDMYKYVPKCDAVLQVSTLNELTKAVDTLLS
jgi:uncharacterized protein with von Willebrand factor type A (vWA) domain